MEKHNKKLELYLQRWLVIIESEIYKLFGSWDWARERWGRTQSGNNGSVTGRWKKVVETGIRFANTL